MKSKPKDNSTFIEKVALRKRALKRLADRGIATPIVMETHGGRGELFDVVYAHLPRGVVFEKQPDKTARLAKQRPTWAVYETDCVSALSGGVGGHLTVDLLDADPWGSPWEAIEAFFSSARPFAPRLVVVVFDGLRESIKRHSAWRIPALSGVMERYGNNLYPIYLDVCRELMGIHASRADYRLVFFSGYYCGYQGQITHYLAELEQA